MSSAREAAGPFGAFHHVGIAVERLQPYADAIAKLTCGEIVDSGHDEQLAVAWLWIAAPACPIIELLAPSDEEGPVAKYLARRGTGIHHLSFSPPSLTSAKRHVERCDLEAFGENDNHAGYEELFVRPGLLGGALLHTFRPLHADGEPSRQLSIV